MICANCNKNKLTCSCNIIIDYSNAIFSSHKKYKANKIKTFNIKINVKDLCKQDIIDKLTDTINELESLYFPLDEIDDLQKQITGMDRAEIRYWSIKSE